MRIPAYKISMIVGIMLIVVLAGIITIYSVYYVSMNQRVREFGKLKAIGATKRQLRQIVLREGMGVALFAIPIGLLIGTVAVKVVLLQFVEHAKDSNVLITEAYKVVAKGEVQLYYWWIYLLAIAVTLCTVYLSLMKPMRMAAKVSEIEAMRYQGVVCCKGYGKRQTVDIAGCKRLRRILYGAADTKGNGSDRKNRCSIHYTCCRWKRTVHDHKSEYRKRKGQSSGRCAGKF